MRRNAATDANHTEIVAALLNIGADVRDTHRVGQGFPDLVVGYCGQTYLVEVIAPDAKPYWRKEHEDRRANWKGGTWLIVSSVDEMLTALGVEVQV